MNKAHFKLLMALVLSILAPLPLPSFAESATQMSAPGTQAGAEQADIEVFVRNGCPHCAEAEQFLAALKLEKPGLHIVIRDITEDVLAFDRLKTLAETRQENGVRVPAFWVGGQLIIGYSEEASTGTLIREALSAKLNSKPTGGDDAGSCEAEQSLECGPDSAEEKKTEAERFEVTLLGKHITLEDVGLPLFTLAMGLLDGFNPCSMWVLLLMVSMLAPMGNRPRMLAVAGIFVAVQGLAYFVFMAAWLNLFLLIGLSRVSQLAIAAIAIVAGAINLKDFRGVGSGISLSIPASAKPGIYARMRSILQAENLTGAMIGAVVLAVLVQVVELLCTSGFPALYTRILTLRQLDSLSYYAYLLLYNVAYMFDDVVILAIGVITLSQQRLQEKEGRRLKLISGLVMVGLGVYLLF
ncbi:MAG: NrdH-redoxin [Methylococcaceae bacterium]|nr:NrdH-redoxin [Methylococcaceae bacterium]